MGSAPVITPEGIPTAAWQSNHIIMPPAAGGAATTSRGWPPPPPSGGDYSRHCNVVPHQYVPGNVSDYSIRPAMMFLLQYVPEGGGLLPHQ